MPGRDWTANYRRIQYLVGARFPGLTTEVKERWSELQETEGAEDSTVGIAQSLNNEFELNIHDIFRSVKWSIVNPSVDDVLLWLEAIAKYRSELKSMPYSKTADIYNEYTLPSTEEELARLRRKDLNYFFAARSASADFERWCRLAIWTAEECVALSLGKDPKVVNSESLVSQVDADSPFLESYFQRLDSVRRAMKAGIFSKAVPPKKFISWAVADAKMELPGELIAPGQVAIPKYTPHPDEEIDARHRSSYQKIMLGLAIKHYGLDPFAPDYSRAYKSIADDLSSLGIELTQESVKTHLKAALTKSESGRNWMIDVKSKKFLIKPNW